MIEGESSRSRKVALFVTGGIASYKACEILRGLQKNGCDVRVAITEAATEFVGPKTFEALTAHEVYIDVFESSSPIPHIELAEWADIALVAPATANVMAKMAYGIADDMVSTALLACSCPIIVAPAMNVHMWENPATQQNAETLESRGVFLVGPATGRLACGDTGTGKLAEVDQIVSATLARLRASSDLAGKHVVITAGPTHEAIDPVRYLSNASSGKMGYAVAEAAAAHGARVTLVSGPVALPAPTGVAVVHVTSAQEMLDATVDAFATADAAILAAAVADYRPAVQADHKLKKGKEDLSSIELVENPDILATISKDRGDRIVIGFAAETNDVIDNAKKKLARKGCDLIVANDVTRADSTFGSDTDSVTLVGVHSETEYPCMPKAEVANVIVSELAHMLEPEVPVTDATIVLPVGDNNAREEEQDSTC